MTTEYWQNREYKPKYHLGDRVFGHWNKIPFVGKVGVDNVLTNNQKPRVTVILDLPLRFDKKYFNTVAFFYHTLVVRARLSKICWLVS